MNSVPFLAVMKQVEIIGRVTCRVNMDLLVTIIRLKMSHHVQSILLCLIPAVMRLFYKLDQVTGLHMDMAEALAL